MYRKKNRELQSQIQFISLEDLVPKDHILRAIDRAIDFSFIYYEVEGLYSSYEAGRPGIDPVSLFKIVFIQYLFGIRSMRQTIKEINVNVAYRWFIGYGLTEPIPHFSTFGKNYVRRFKDTDIFEHIFNHILQEAVNAGFVDASAIFIDGTHIKASANRNKIEKISVTKSARQYQDELDKEINNDRNRHGKSPLKKDETPKETTRTVSTTDPDSGLFVKGEHERCMAYVANTACDRHNFILGFHVGAGNIHDSQMFHDVYKKISPFADEIETVAVDAGYKTPGIMREILSSGKIPAVPYKRPMTKEGFFRKYEYVYDEYYDCYICPANKILKYAPKLVKALIYMMLSNNKSVPNNIKASAYFNLSSILSLSRFSNLLDSPLVNMYLPISFCALEKLFSSVPGYFLFISPNFSFKASRFSLIT